MSPRTGRFSVPGLIVRIIARCTAGLCILVLLAFMMPEDGVSFLGQWSWRNLDAWSIVFPFGYLLGLVVLLWKDVWGGIISVGCIAALSIRFSLAGDAFDPVLASGAVPGILAVVAWWLSRRHEAGLLPRASR